MARLSSRRALTDRPPVSTTRKGDGRGGADRHPRRPATPHPLPGSRDPVSQARRHPLRDAGQGLGRGAEDDAAGGQLEREAAGAGQSAGVQELGVCRPSAHREVDGPDDVGAGEAGDLDHLINRPGRVVAPRVPDRLGRIVRHSTYPLPEASPRAGPPWLGDAWGRRSGCRSRHRGGGPGSTPSLEQRRMVTTPAASMVRRAPQASARSWDRISSAAASRRPPTTETERTAALRPARRQADAIMRSRWSRATSVIGAVPSRVVRPADAGTRRGYAPCG